MPDIAQAIGTALRFGGRPSSALANDPDELKHRAQARVVLSADVASYVRLTQADEHGTHRRLMACRTGILDPLVEQRGGRVTSGTGDGIIADFPSAASAVECALAIQQAIASLMADEPPAGRLAFRIGIALGEVSVEPDGIYGDVVNLAVRLQGEAEPGGICASTPCANRRLGHWPKSPALLRWVRERSSTSLTP